MRQTVPVRFRQVHLDFHTSGLIDSVAAEFDPEEFAATLERAHVDSVTCFARCHHGWIYYDTAPRSPFVTGIRRLGRLLARRQEGHT
jgi:hypothetical protein